LGDELKYDIPVAQDDLTNLVQKLIQARPSEFDVESAKALIKQAKNSSAMCIFLPDKSSELKPALIAFDKEFVTKRRTGVPMYGKKGKRIYGNDGYNHYTDKMPPEWQVHLTYCHELAHSMLPSDYDKTHPGGHGLEHEALLKQFMTKLYPEFAKMNFYRYKN